MDYDNYNSELLSGTSLPEKVCFWKLLSLTWTFEFTTLKMASWSRVSGNQ